MNLIFPPLSFKPQSVLFCCTMNSIRSAMAEAMLKKSLGTAVYIDSAGIRHGEPDYFMHEVLQEIGVDGTKHKSKTFNDLKDDYFDLIIALSPEAHHHAVEFTRTMECGLMHWKLLDPSLTEGSRADKLLAYRMVRDQIAQNIHELIKFYKL